jgi:FkbM family methyltransferase
LVNNGEKQKEMYQSIKQSAFLMFPSLTNAIRAIKQTIVDKKLRPYVAKHFYGRWRLSVTIEDRIAEQWYAKDTSAPREFALLSGRGLNEGGLIFDLGAHQGVIAMMLAKEVGAKGKVIAVEASLRNAELAKKNVAMNGLRNLVVRHAAVVSADGPVFFTQRGNGAVARNDREFRAASVDGISIDTLSHIYGVPDLVYMDIEGFEAEALRGAINTLSSSTSWFIEVHGDDVIGQYGGANRTVVKFFENGYDLYSAIDNEVDDFQPLINLEALPKGRFFLAAIPRE